MLRNRKLQTVGGAFFLLIGSAAATSVSAQEADPDKLSLDPAVAAQIIPHLASQDTPQMPSLVETISIVPAKGFGKPSQLTTSTHRRRLDNGLYEITGNHSGVGVEGSGVSLSMCGLLSVLSGGKSRNVVTSTGIVPWVGALFELHLSSDSATSTRITLLESSSSLLCNIEPGATFSYKVEVQVILNQKGQLARSKRSEFRNSSTTECTAGILKKSASQIAPSLHGEYIEVSCGDPKGQSGVSVRAYLLDYHYYLALESKSKSVDSKLSYSELDDSR